MKPLLTTEQAAAIIRMRPSFLEARRWRGKGPPFLKIGRSVRYRPEDLAAWTEERLRRSTSDPGPPGEG